MNKYFKFLILLKRRKIVKMFSFERENSVLGNAARVAVKPIGLPLFSTVFLKLLRVSSNDFSIKYRL